MRVRRRLHHLHDARDLEREDADEQHAEHGRDDLLPLLLRLQRIDVLLASHYGAPVADAPAGGALEVVVVSVVEVVDVVGVGIVAWAGAPLP